MTMATTSLTLAWTPTLAHYYKAYELVSGAHKLIGKTGPGAGVFKVNFVRRGTHYYVVHAVDQLGHESKDSNVVKKTI
jgi:hypothetical protein